MTESEWLEIGYNSGAVMCDIIIAECTFKEAYHKWFSMKKYSVRPQTLDRLECTYNRHISGTEYETMFISAMGTKFVADMITSIMLACGGLDEREYKRLYQIVNNVLVYCYDIEYGGAQLIDWNKVKRYVPRCNVHEVYYTEKAVCDDVIALLEHKVLNERIYPMKQSACICLVLNFYLGLRVGELAGLRWCDVDLFNKVLYVRQAEKKAYERDETGKRVRMHYEVVGELKTGRSYRDVPLCDKAVDILLQLKAHHECMGYGSNSQYLAYDGSETVLVKSLERTLKRLCVLSDIQPFNTHLIRKTFASRLHNSGMPTRIISNMMGHADMSTTERCYILAYSDEIRQARDMMNDIYVV